jgi:hypothetical protein
VTWGSTELADSLFGSGFSATQPINVVRQHPYPALVIAGSSDSVVPVSNAERLVKASGGLMRLEIFLGAGHDAAITENWGRYAKSVLSYVERRIARGMKPQAVPPSRRRGAGGSLPKRSNAGYSRYQGPPQRSLR